MTEVLFYHLTERTLEEALPGLLEKSLERGWRVVVQAGSRERLEALDGHLVDLWREDFSCRTRWIATAPRPCSRSG